MNLTEEQYEEVKQKLGMNGIDILKCPLSHSAHNQQTGNFHTNELFFEPYREGIEIIRVRCKVCGYTLFFDPDIAFTILQSSIKPFF